MARLATRDLKKSMAGAAVVAGTPAASLRTGSSDKLGPALKAKGRNFLAYFFAIAFRTLDRGFAKYDLLEIFLAIFTMIFKNWHHSLLFYIITFSSGENKGFEKFKAAGSKVKRRGP
jgi:hypothetical protein